MLEEGSKPRPAADRGGNRGETGAVEPTRYKAGLLASPWLGTGVAIAVAVLLGGAILLASAPEATPGLWPWLADNYWLLAAFSALTCLGCGKDVQLGGLRNLARGRITGDLIVALGADAALGSAILIGAGYGAV